MSIVQALDSLPPDQALSESIRLGMNIGSVPENERVEFLQYCLKLSGIYKDKKEFAKAATAITIVANLVPHIYTMFKDLFFLWTWAGESDRAMECAKLYCMHGENVVSKEPDAELNIRFLQDNWMVTRIGELVDQLDAFVRARMLGLLPNYQCFMLVAEGTVCNRALLDYFRPWVNVVTDPDAIRRLTPMSQRLPFPTFLMHLKNGYAGLYSVVAPSFYRLWQQTRTAPLLTLRLDHYRLGWEYLGRYGMKEGERFVAMHVRGAGHTVADGDDLDYHRVRNADILNYVPAIKEITARGDWVVRFGAAHMEPLPELERVVDLSAQDSRPDWLDLFLCSESMFFLGTPSGPAGIPKCFGKPTLLCDFTYVGFSTQMPGSRVVPKLVWSQRDGRALTLEENLFPPVKDMTTPWVLERLQLRMIDNTPEQIRRAVVNMLAHLDGTEPADPTVEACHRVAAEIYQRAGRVSSFDFDPTFVLDHPEWFGTPERYWHDWRPEHTAPAP